MKREKADLYFYILRFDLMIVIISLSSQNSKINTSQVDLLFIRGPIPDPCGTP